MVVPKIIDPKDPTRSAVTELRNDREISRAVLYVESELRTYLELDQADTEGKVLILKGLLKIIKNIGLGQTGNELAATIDELLETVTELDQAALDLIAGAQAQANEFGAELEKLQRFASPSPTLTEIEVEIKRRTEWSENKGQEQENLQNSCDEKRIELQTIEQELKFEVHGKNKRKIEIHAQQLKTYIRSIEQKIERIIDLLSVNRREVTLLENCARAIKLVEEQWATPKKLIGKKLD